MALETTTTTIAGAINTSLIARVMSNYAIDNFVALSHLRMESVAGRGTNTAAFAIPTKATVGAGPGEGTPFSNTALTITKTTVACSEVGITRLVTKQAARFSVLGAEDEVYNFVIEDGARLTYEKMETDAWAQFPNASASVGTTNTAMAIADFASGVSQMSINKATGPYLALLTTIQVRDLRAAAAASAAPILTAIGFDQLIRRVGEDGFVGSPMGVPTWTSNLATTANAGVDKVGVFMVDGNAKPDNAPFAVALGWAPEPVVLASPTYPGVQATVTAAYGMGEIADFNYVKVVTKGT